MQRRASGIAPLVASMPLALHAQVDDFRPFNQQDAQEYLDFVEEPRYTNEPIQRPAEQQPTFGQATFVEDPAYIDFGDVQFEQDFTAQPETAATATAEVEEITDPMIRQAVPNPYEMESSPVQRVSWFSNNGLLGRYWKSNDACSNCEGDNCNGECGASCCYDRIWEHRTGLSGSFLYLHARDVDVPYTTNVNGNILSATPLTPTRSFDPDHQPGFRVGLAYALDCESSITANYTFFESDTDDSVNVQGGAGFLRPEIVLPNTLNVFSDAFAANGNYRIDFQLADVNFKGLVYRSHRSYLNAELGFRYANLDQDLVANYDTVGETFEVLSEIDFDGYGPRIGFDAARSFGRRGLMGYTNGSASFLAGEFTSNHRQTNLTTTVTQGSAGFDDDRIVPQLDYEVGLGWTSCSGHVVLKAGYYVSAWFNSVTTPGFIRPTQANNTYDSVDDTLTFDGLTASAEVRF